MAGKSKSRAEKPGIAFHCGVSKDGWTVWCEHPATGLVPYATCSNHHKAQIIVEALTLWARQQKVSKNGGS